LQTESFLLGEAEITLETGRIARQADGAVLLRHGRTVLLATVVAAGAPVPGVDFVPLTVEYREKTAAAGRIPGNFFRRETRPGEPEVLVSRLIDRSLRPLFPTGWTVETQVLVTVYSAENGSDPAGLAILAAAAALQVSDIPFQGPVAGLRILRRGGKLVLLPDEAEGRLADLDLVLAATPSGLVMVEGEASGVPEAAILAALDAGTAALAPAWAALERLGAGRTRRAVPTVAAAPVAEVDALVGAEVDAALVLTGKGERRAALAAVRAEVRGALGVAALPAVDAVIKARARAAILAGRRADGRGHADVRPITCETGTLPACHGSALFTRGETQVLVSGTLGGQRDAQDVERLFGMTRDRFLLHYNFPSFSVGEVGGKPGPGRREIGHGNLARRAVAAVLPTESSYPFTLRVVSDVTESNGSSSMATVCGATLALIDAGVPLTAPVAGVAMGLVREGDQVAVLTDILGDEDHLGDMDFKVAGTAEGITAIQLDNKLGSLPRSVLDQALSQAREGRLHILAAMQPAIDALGGRVPEHTPRHERVRINPGRIGLLVGPGGKNLQQIQGRTGARIEVNQDGTVMIMGRDRASTREAARAVQAISIELVKGGLYMGTVQSVKDFGAFVRIAEHDGLVHISELGGRTVAEGESLLVRVLGADDKGRLKLSHRAADGASALEALNA